MATVFIAENDPHALDHLTHILSDHLPQVSLDLCSSAEELCHKRTVSSCDTMVISPVILQGYKLLKPKWMRHVASPILVTASPMDRISASQCLAKDAFDLIVKPIVTEHAVQSVEGALWQSRLLTLLASRERATSKFEQHMAAFPDDWKTKEKFANSRVAFERTFEALKSSLKLILDEDTEWSLYEIAGTVESITKQLAFERLLTLSKDGTIP